MADELRGVFEDYEYPDRGTIETLLENGRVELSRLARAALVTYELHQELPSLVFDGQLAPLSTMLANLGPDASDAAKVYRHLRSEGETG